MQVSVEKKEGIHCVLNIELPATEIDAEVSKRIQRIAKTAKVDGFRPGKVPTGMIKKKYGEQWDFCNCVVKGDSLNKALSNEKLSDEELDKLLLRFDEIDKKCQAFKIVDANRTPKERALHEKKVKKCLKEAGID